MTAHAQVDACDFHAGLLVILGIPKKAKTMATKKADTPAAPVKVARIYMRVSTDAQDLARQEAIATSARAAATTSPASTAKRRRALARIASSCCA